MRRRNLAEWSSDGPVDDAPARDGDGRRASMSDRRWIRGGSRSATLAKNLYTAFRPREAGDQDLDGDGDSDLVDESTRDDALYIHGLRLARPLLR